MHDISPFYRWEKFYRPYQDPQSPFYGKKSSNQYENEIYGYYIHPDWDYVGSETLYIKILFVDYQKKILIMELLGEWNDTLHNDIMHLKRNIIDEFLKQEIQYFILIGENVLNFHGSDDCYYEEWFEELEQGWIALLNFRDFVLKEMTHYNLDSYLIWGGLLDQIDDWRTQHPLKLFQQVAQEVRRRIG
jgi:hypothetical protein